MSDPEVRVERDGPVVVLTLDRPRALNALGTAMADELGAAAATIAADRGVRAVVVTGAGDRAFCAGADIAEFGALASPEQFHAFIARLALGVEALAALPQPVIAAVEGLALGGGCELAMACDLRVVGANARFGLPEIKLGLLPGLAGTQRAIRLLPGAVARRMLLTGEPITAAEAHAHGFCEPPVPAGDALAAARSLAATLAAGPPDALAAAKRLVAEGAELDLAAARTHEQLVVKDLFGTADGREGVQAFLGKRAARFGLDAPPR
jgi:enoyl-CoA hydratase/carnithine racemase